MPREPPRRASRVGGRERQARPASPALAASRFHLEGGVLTERSAEKEAVKTAIEMDWDAIEPARSRLRWLVAQVTRELEDVERGAEGRQIEGLSLAWSSLVVELALGVEPALRECPHCRRGILQAAVRCRYCMSRSSA